MELLLNLIWLLMAIPAICLWRNARGAQIRSFSSVQCLLALGCGLVLLFPVISATDDLHAMSAEMEESASSKRNVRHAGGEKSSSLHSQWHNPPAAVSAVNGIVSFSKSWQELRTASPVLVSIPSTARLGRAPPASRLV